MSRRRLPCLLWLCSLSATACVTPADELLGLAQQPPLDCAVLVTGGAFLAPARSGGATFAAAGSAATPPAGSEAIPIEAFADVLRRGKVFQRVAVDPDPANRARANTMLSARQGGADLASLLDRARDEGYDYLLVVEELQDGPIDSQGTNGRWPVTFATWILLGVGAFIPDRTFESRAKLRVTLRELQMGRLLHDPLLVAGPVDLALTERTDFWGLVMSIVVPPFWVGDDPAAVANSVRATTQRRLLLSLARELKSELARQRLRDQAAAAFTLSRSGDEFLLTVDALEGLALARLRLETEQRRELGILLGEKLLASGRVEGGHFRYQIALPPELVGERVQIVVGTLRGAIASATYRPGGSP